MHQSFAAFIYLLKMLLTVKVLQLYPLIIKLQEPLKPLLITPNKWPCLHVDKLGLILGFLLLFLSELR